MLNKLIRIQFLVLIGIAFNLDYLFAYEISNKEVTLIVFPSSPSVSHCIPGDIVNLALLPDGHIPLSYELESEKTKNLNILQVFPKKNSGEVKCYVMLDDRTNYMFTLKLSDFNGPVIFIENVHSSVNDSNSNDELCLMKKLISGSEVGGMEGIVINDRMKKPLYKNNNRYQIEVTKEGDGKRFVKYNVLIGDPDFKNNRLISTSYNHAYYSFWEKKKDESYNLFILVSNSISLKDVEQMLP